MAGSATGILELSYQASAACIRMRFVSLTGDQTVALTTGAGTRPLGVARLSVSTQEAARGKSPAVQVLGVAFIESGAAFGRDVELTPDATGRAVAAAAGNRVAAVSMKAAAAAGEWVPCLLIPAGRVA